jgi:DNA-binding NtrC family response regulator
MNNRILIIESDPFDKDVFSKILSDSYEVKIMATSRGGAKACRDFQPQVILFDMRLHDIRDLQNFIAVKNSYDEKVPVIVIVSDTTPDMEQSVRKLGIFYYLVKPYDFKELGEVLQGAFCKKNCHQAMEPDGKHRKKEDRYGYVSIPHKVRRANNN